MADTTNNKPNPPSTVDPVQAELEAVKAELAALKAASKPVEPKQAGTAATTTVPGGKYKVGDVYRDASGKYLGDAKDED